MASDYCYAKEMMRAMERHKNGEAVVIPIFLSACDWQNAPFSKLQGLPHHAKPIKNWNDRDEAWLDVVRGLRKVIENFRPPKHSAESSSIGDAAPLKASFPEEPPQIQSAVELDFNGRQRLVEALLECDCLATPQSRDQVLKELPEEVRSRISRFPNAKQDVLSAVNTCQQFMNGLQTFLKTVEYFEGDSRPWRKVQTILREVIPDSYSEAT